MLCDLFTMKELRDWAELCERAAHNPMISGDERARLLEMQRGLAELENERAWLDGTKAMYSDVLRDVRSTTA